MSPRPGGASGCFPAARSLRPGKVQFELRRGWLSRGIWRSGFGACKFRTTCRQGKKASRLRWFAVGGGGGGGVANSVGVEAEPAGRRREGLGGGRRGRLGVGSECSLPWSTAREEGLRYARPAVRLRASPNGAMRAFGKGRRPGRADTDELRTGAAREQGRRRTAGAPGGMSPCWLPRNPQPVSVEPNERVPPKGTEGKRLSEQGWSDSASGRGFRLRGLGGTGSRLGVPRQPAGGHGATVHS